MERIINFISKSPPFCLGFGPLSMIWAWGHKQKLSKLSRWIISKVESSCIKYIFFRASIFFRSLVWRGILDLMFFRGCRGISAKVWEGELKNAKTERNFNILVLGKKNCGAVPECGDTTSIISAAESWKAKEDVCIRVQRPTTEGITWRHDVSSSNRLSSLIDLYFTLSFILNQLFSNSEMGYNNHGHANTRIQKNKHSNLTPNF